MLLRKMTKKISKALLITVVAVILASTFLVSITPDLIISIVSAAWISIIINKRLEGKFSIFLALLLIIFSLLFLVTNQENAAEKLSIWSYTFLLIGTIQQLLEKIFSLKKLTRINRHFFKNILSLVVDAIGNVRKIYTKHTPQYYWTVIIILLLTILYYFFKELLFYKSFFINNFIKEFTERLLWVLIVCDVIIMFLGARLRKALSKSNKLIIPLTLILTAAINQKICSAKRSEFENRPYILQLKPAIAAEYSKITIIGRNFKNLPFKGEVLINQKRQLIKKWSDDEIIIITDSILTESGKLIVTNKYENEKTIESNPKEFIFINSKTASEKEKELYWKSLIENNEK